MARRLPILAAIAEAPALMMEAMRAALEEYEVIVVSKAQEYAPVRQAFKNPKGQKKRTRALVGKYAYLNVGQQGRGARMLIRRRDRSPLNKHGGGRDFIVGRQTHRRSITSGEVTNFEGRAGATSFKTEVGKTSARSGQGSRPKYAIGYGLGQPYQSHLTSRARSNLTRGIGVNKVGAATPANPTGASFSAAPSGSLIIGGALRDSIHGMGVEETGTGLEVRITAGVRYAPYVEYGTYKDVAQPFMRPAIKDSKRKLGPILKKHLRAAGFVTKG